ncbi:MAG: DUF3575 domain-containing protein [Bacteroidaceae bacterium]|nr:DUF3575 domain-containing protein [Bacteroidaceae bacterium]
MTNIQRHIIRIAGILLLMIPYTAFAGKPSLYPFAFSSTPTSLAVTPDDLATPYLLAAVTPHLLAAVTPDDLATEAPDVLVTNDPDVLVTTDDATALSTTTASDPAQAPGGPFFPDTLDYKSYSFIRFVGTDDAWPLSDEEFFDIAGRVVFPVNKWDIPKNDPFLRILEQEVIPLINRDHLQFERIEIRGAASPEGPYLFNKFLGEHRAQTLIDFMNARLSTPISAKDFDLNITFEDYPTLCIMMRRANDPDYDYVKGLCDKYLPSNQVMDLKAELQAHQGGRLWQRLFRDYYAPLRAARVVFYFRAHKEPSTEGASLTLPEAPQPVTPFVIPQPQHSGTTVVTTPATDLLTERQPRREVLAIKSNLLFDFAYVPGYDRWCPIPNIALEFFPLHGHFTFGASFDGPWWQHYHEYKFFQIRNYQLEARYYIRSGDILRNPPGKGAAFRGFYLQAYTHLGLFGICFDENRGWVGEGLGAGIGLGYVLPLSRKGHWRLEFGIQAGFFACKYDPYQYEYIGVPGYEDYPHDDLYYYKYYGDPSLFKERQYRFTWFGPTRVGITLSYDLLYRRNRKKGASFRSWEKGIEITPAPQ